VGIELNWIDIKKESEPVGGNWKSEKPLSEKRTACKPRDVFLALAVALLLVLLLMPLSAAAAVFTNNVQLTAATAGNDQKEPRIAVDSNGASHITWMGYNPTTGGAVQIWYADNTSGAWPAPTQLTSATGFNSQNSPQIAVDSNGASHITWTGPDPTTGGVYQIWYADNISGSWPAPTQLTSATGGNGQKYSEIAVDSNGASHITWGGYTTGGAMQIWYADNTSGAWPAPTQLTSATGFNSQNSPQIAVDSNGASHITWGGPHPTTGGAYQVWYADNISGSWPAPTQLTSATGFNGQSSPQIAVGLNGASHITWYGPDPTTGGVYQVWYADNTSGSWPAPTQLTSATGSNHQNSPQIAVDSNGASHITWGGYHPTTGGAVQIWYSGAVGPTVTGLTPASGANDNSALPVTVTGSDFQSGATLTLTGPDTIGTVATTGSGNTLNATLDLTGKNTGSYRATVTNPDLITGSMDNAFTVTLNTYTVTASVSGIGGTAIPLTQTVNYGANATININPGDDYRTASVTDNSTLVTPTPSTSYTINNVTGDHDVVITFEPIPTPTWYLAEGTNAWGFSTYITIENPNNSELHAELTYMGPNPVTGRGRIAGQTVTLPALSQTTLSSEPDIGNTDFSTKVECTEGKTIAVDRTMYWTGQGAPCPEAHNSIGVTAPARTWYLPEGSSEWGFETWTLVQNPNPTEASVTLTYMTEYAGPKVVVKKIPAYSRATYNMEQDIGAHDSSIKVASDVPVIAERSQYRNKRREGSCSIGTTAPATDYFLSEGTTAWGFTTYVLIQNPQDTATDVTVTYMTPSGPMVQPPIQIQSNSRKTIRVNDIAEVSNTDLSTSIHGSAPIIAERAMYWGANTPLGEACHDSIGMAKAHATFYLPDGETSNGRETWTLVQNPNPSAVTVEVSYLKAGGGAETLTSSIPANSRMTFNMTDKIPSGRASIMVTSKTAGKKIMVERAMYWNNRGAGTDTIGGFSD